MTWNVPTDYTTLTNALASGRVVAGDIIEVDPTYVPEESVTVKFDVTIQSEDPTTVVYLPAMVVNPGVTLAVYDAVFAIGVASTVSAEIGLAEIALRSATFLGSNIYLVPDGTTFGLYAVDSTVDIDDLFATDFPVGSPVVYVEAKNADTRLDVSRCAMASNYGGAFVFVDLSSAVLDADIDNCQFMGNSAESSGADIYSEGADVVGLTQSTSTDAVGGYKGGSIAAAYSVVTLDTVQFERATAAIGGAISVYGGELHLTDVDFTDGVAKGDEGGADIASSYSDLSFTGVTSQGAIAPNGGSLSATGGTLDASALTVTGATTTGHGGAMGLIDLTTVSLKDSTFCGNRSLSTSLGGAAIAVRDSDITAIRTVFQANDSVTGGALDSVDSQVSLIDVTFVDNNAGSGSALAVDRGSIRLLNDIFSGSDTAVSVTEESGALGASYNLYFGNRVDLVGLSTTGHDVLDDPLYSQAFVSSDCDTLPTIQESSPARGASDPAVVDADGDPEIGALGWDGIEDTDVPTETGDTDETGETGEPVAEDDLDGDGFPVSTDCDDDDPAIHPGAEDGPEDEVDQDCDGFASTQRVGGGCGCASGEAPMTGLGLALTLVVAKRRRRGSAVARP